MDNEDQIEELKRIIEEERAEKAAKDEHRRALMRGYSRASKARRKADPEIHARDRAATNARRKETKATTMSMRRKRERLAGRPKPETCEVCGRGGNIVFEHCHISNKFRGWTCDRCNTALGMVEDDITVLEKLIVYLKAHNHADDE